VFQKPQLCQAANVGSKAKQKTKDKKMKRNSPKASHIVAHATFPSLETNPQWHKLQFWQRIIANTN